MNVAMTSKGELVEVQATAEGQTFSIDEMNDLVGLAKSGINQLITLQKEALKLK